ncbi:MAG: hypothetical protein A3C30_00330 [Candidatus Levybacteria bacterium RIFCSPHIGHO2_02_FULL_40_18]|nr:MAG: hypothetical protein A2869_04025 [Candidatus Levybacteria bacterium RIFCSPHIGHO2_01_FULL_40_58]OGH27150.1 MAG: hypothetical protein A3C30_00330 [Candidatus Levybacteria bacterium RIFCSPHIGHO2_02_FULL_40_18]OGH31009.1 MAG: hypothetical protein A3E43_04745 [Candidatus Levybacteria bacterium RIFCSPHIGHO2_12_FULL_40_31]OGH41020.1 MAG: hypothetical protein A2894_01960 [Candidatus Levybacteria bacterium RIFCSPLOWO2_01_FULL_40_64]OGH49458.1 MAG: hypothetical protein A3I54_02335 [Candidatus Lev
MEFIKKNALIVGLIVVVVLGIGGFFVWNQFQSQTLTPKGEEQQNVKQMSPEDIGLELTLRSDGKAVIVKATKVEGIKSFEYELTYDAQVTEDGESATVPRGAVGELTIRGGIAQAEVDLGTCSANVCKYDKVVSDVKVVIKVNFENGEIGAVEDTILLEEE